VAGRSTRSLGVMYRAISAAVLAISCNANAAPFGYTDDLAPRTPRYRIFFPPFKLVGSETGSGRVTALKVTVHCAYVTGISRIPGDWWVSVQGPVSGETIVEASAGHGVSYLASLKAWNGSISVTPYEMECFNVEAEVITDGPDEKKDLRTVYSRKQLKLVP
jgi:hypothetical protein